MTGPQLSGKLDGELGWNYERFSVAVLALVHVVHVNRLRGFLCNRMGFVFKPEMCKSPCQLAVLFRED